MGAPVLVETQLEQKIKERKAEFKEKKMLSLDRKGLKDQGHKKPEITEKSFEMQLRKIATQGVVRLFNAVQEFQRRGDENVDQKLISKVPVRGRARKIEKVSKEAFEDILRSGPKKKRKLEGSTRRLGDPMDEFD